MHSRHNNITHRRRVRRAKRQDGVALVFALIAVAILSMLAAGIMYTTQSEIWTTASYRQTVQARYVAEAGVENAAYWLYENSGNLAKTLSSDVVMTTVPVTYNSQPLYIQGDDSNPVLTMTNSSGVTTSTFGKLSSGTVAGSTMVSSFQSSVGAKAYSQTPFGGASSTSLSTNANADATIGSSGGYKVAIQLLSAQPTTAGSYLTKWKIIAVGTVGGVRTTNVQVSEILEGVLINASDSSTKPVFNYGLLATGTDCGVIQMGGTSKYTTSFDSSTDPTASTNTHHGDIATAGSIYVTDYTIDGSVYTSRSNGITSLISPYYLKPSGAQGPYIGGGLATSTCGDSKYAQYAVYETDNSGMDVVTNSKGNPHTDSSLQNCYQNQNCPTGYNDMTGYTGQDLPDVSDVEVTMPNVSTNTSACSATPICAGSGYYDSTLAKYVTTATLAGSSTTNYGNVTVAGSTTLILLAGQTYNFNSLTVTAAGKLEIDNSSCTSNCATTINIVGANNSGDTAVTIAGAGIVNDGSDPATLQINYNGYGNIDFTASANYWGTIDAPNANFLASGAGSVYGAVIAKTAKFSGDGVIHYDTHLKVSGPSYQSGSLSYTASPFFVSEFSWNAY